ncbi:MAG: hypothetical protein IT356_04095 [Gemmatimonadaceae bacterium]|nr:hypothetical protein [Gemmatimonadaceae bacterium]
MSGARPGAPHFDRPADAAGHIAAESAVIVTAADGAQAATYAVAIARAAVAAGRRVALADGCGGLAPIYALAGGEDAPGLTECFRDGTSLSEIARPVPENPNLFVLPAGNVHAAPGALADVTRWDRLIRGFAEAGGLLVVAAVEGSAAFAALASAGAAAILAGSTSGAVHGLGIGGLRVVATVGAARPARNGRRRLSRRVPWPAAAVAAMALAFLGGWLGVRRVRAANGPDGLVVLAPRSRFEAPPSPRGEPTPPPDTLSIEQRTPAADRAHLAGYAIRVVATNTSADANSTLSGSVHGADLPAATIAVVAAPASRGRAMLWHEVIFGAWPERAEAESALAGARRRKLVRADGGAVVHALYAVLLLDNATPERARAALQVWLAKGVAPYALRQEDGTLRVYAGAFETVAQAVTMATMIHAAGGAAIVAYRTGRPD